MSGAVLPDHMLYGVSNGAFKNTFEFVERSIKAPQPRLVTAPVVKHLGDSEIGAYVDFAIPRSMVKPYGIDTKAKGGIQAEPGRVYKHIAPQERSCLAC